MRCDKCRGEGTILPSWAAASSYFASIGRGVSPLEETCPECNGVGRVNEEEIKQNGGEHERKE